jgi:formylglycine-generating enzyme required for sulfatase activity
VLLQPTIFLSVLGTSLGDSPVSRAFRILIAAILLSGGSVGLAWAKSGSSGGGNYVIRSAAWTEADERDYSAFIQAIGRSGCNTVDSCLKGSGNSFRNTDPPGVSFYSDCAQLPYVLRAYFAWKRGLPFSYESGISPRGATTDIRYSQNGNQVTGRTDVLTGSTDGYRLMRQLIGAISTASYRIHPALEHPKESDLYSAALRMNSVRPGTIIYDPDGHVATVYEVQRDGRIQYMDGHPDNTVTRGTYDLRFVRGPPAVGSGFKNWRPSRLVGYSQGGGGALVGGQIVLATNAEISDYSDEQFYGNGPRTSDESWASGTFALNGEQLDYYDYVRAMMAGGTLEMHPVVELSDMVDELCTDLHDRVQAVSLSVAAGIQNRPEPGRLPRNIYGTSGDWETYSTPSRDARLKTAFKEMRDNVVRFINMYRSGNHHLLYSGTDLVGDLLRTYDAQTAKCSVSYTRTDSSSVALPFEEVRTRLFKLSFDPYQCVERRWGATDPSELSTCQDGSEKQAWYAAEQNLRNQIDRTYDARMDFTLADLQTPGPGKGWPNPPNVDTRSVLLSTKGVTRGSQPVAATDPSSPTTPRFNLSTWRAQRQADYAVWQQSHSPNQVWDSPEAPRMVAIRGGSFVMGSPPSEVGRFKTEGPQHEVAIAHDFAVSAYPVTFDEWDACVQDGGCSGYSPPDEHWGRGNHPVVNVSWNDAQAYIAWLNRKTGRHYRLLSEAEYEYAERAGSQTPYATGYRISTNQANFLDAAMTSPGNLPIGQSPTPVGSFPPNAFGLYDMQGSVWEWVQDCWNDSYARTPRDGSPMLGGDCQRRVVRGAAFNREQSFMRSATRYWIVGQLRSALAGFRVALTLN